MTDPARIAVIVGVGQVNDRPADPLQGMEPLDLMRAALEAADKDAGGGWLADVDSIAVVQQISFRAQNPLAEKVGAAIANAIFDATGVRIRRVPLNPARVLAALKAAKVA